MIVFWSGVIELVIEFQTREGWEKKAVLEELL